MSTIQFTAKETKEVKETKETSLDDDMVYSVDSGDTKTEENKKKLEGTVFLEYNGKKYEIEKKKLQISELLKTMMLNTTDNNTLPITSVQSQDTLEILLKVFNHYDGMEGKTPSKPLVSKVLKDFLTEWEAKTYGELPNKVLYDLILDANYLDIKFLLNQLCAIVASKIKGQPLDELNKILSTGLEKKEEKKE